MIPRVHLFLLIETAVFVLAALTHYGLFFKGYEHYQARIAESVIAIVLFLGFLVSVANADWTRQSAIIVQGIALLGTIIGIVTIIIGVGPQTLLDVLYHIIMIGLLIWGLAIAVRAPA